MQETEQTLTEGQIVMGVNFNPSARLDVDYIKQFCANLYDWMQKQPIKFEGARHKAIALTNLEGFQMKAVQAVTYLDYFPEYDDIAQVSPTIGERACTVSFNEGGREDVNYVKTQSAKIYDHMQAFLATARGAFIPYSTDMAEMAVSDALYLLRQWQVWAVKSITR